MIITKITEFEMYKILNVKMRFMEDGVLGEATAFGCTGVLGLEPETKTISKKCAGETKKEVTKTVKINGNISAHVLTAVLMEAFGLTNDGLKEGVFGFNGSKTAQGVLTLEVVDMFEEKKLYIAIPNVSFSSGLKVNIESGQEEIAMTELAFSALKDENEYFYYQAFADDVTDTALLESWSSAFDPSLVKLVAGV